MLESNGSWQIETTTSEYGDARSTKSINMEWQVDSDTAREEGKPQVHTKASMNNAEPVAIHRQSVQFGPTPIRANNQNGSS